MTVSWKYLTNSRVRTYMRCPRQHHIRYELGYIPLTVDEALVLGIIVHLALEAWWIERSPLLRAWRNLSVVHNATDEQIMQVLAEAGPADPLMRAVEAIDRVSPAPDEFVRAKARAMIAAYDKRWSAAPLVAIAVELEFDAPLTNPISGQPSRIWREGGKLDVMAARWRDDMVVDDATLIKIARGEKMPGVEQVIVEHKTSAEDIGIGSFYWRRLRMDGQVSMYFDGAKALGYDPATLVYDVLAKPTLRPSKATPEEERQYTKPKYKQCADCKKKNGAATAPHKHLVGEVEVECQDEPEGRGTRVICTDAGGRLYANMRAADETAAEYEQRLIEWLAENLEARLVRDDIPRHAAELRDNALDLWQIAKVMRDGEMSERAPRNVAACNYFNKPCSYADVCSGLGELTDPEKFKKLDSPHSELTTLTEEI